MRKVCIALLVATVAFAAMPAMGSHTSSQNCPIDTAVAGAANPHAGDFTNDWSGPVLGDGGTGGGDVYREGTDLTAAWIEGDSSGATAVVEVVDLALGDVQVNAFFYVLFEYPDGDPAAPDRTRRWVSGRIRGYASPLFAYGYLGPGTVPGQDQFFTDGETTGSVDVASDSVRIDIPLEAMGITGGEYLVNVIGESRLLAGSPEPLPPPSPFRHGFVFVADTTIDGPIACDAFLSEPAL